MVHTFLEILARSFRHRSWYRTRTAKTFNDALMPVSKDIGGWPNSWAIANGTVGVEKLCDVMSDLPSIDERIFKVKNKRLWQPGERYYEISYQVKVIIGAADLRIELCMSSCISFLVDVADACQVSMTRSCPKTIPSKFNGRNPPRLRKVPCNASHLKTRRTMLVSSVRKRQAASCTSYSARKHRPSNYSECGMSSSRWGTCRM